MSDKLSDRIRPDCEAAPWVVDEIKKLENEVERLSFWKGREETIMQVEDTLYQGRIESLTAEIRLASVYRDLVFKYIDRMSDNVDSDPLERIVGEFVTEFHKVREPLPCDSDRPSPCEHDWDLIGETEKYATHGPDEVGDPVTIYGWKCQKPECGVIQNTITGEPPAADKQPTCCGDATHGCMGLPGADKHETLAEAGKRVADKYGTSDVDSQTAHLIEENRILRQVAHYAERVKDGKGPGSCLGLDQSLDDWRQFLAASAATSQERDDG